MPPDITWKGPQLHKNIIILMGGPINPAQVRNASKNDLTD